MSRPGVVFTPDYIAKVVGTLDLPIRDHTDGRGKIWVLDWKTTARKDNLKQANKDDQMGTYVVMPTGSLRQLGLIGSNESVQGAIWSFAKKTKPPENTDDQGRVRNLPTVAHYKNACSLLRCSVFRRRFKRNQERSIG